MARESEPTRSGREAALKIVRVLRDAGQVAYFAGGCVRDEVMGHPPQDYDVATDAKPERVRELFHNSRYVGEAFGVVLVRLFGHEVEVATFRTESGYQDGRRPTRVEFTDAEHDARRRDFTINGLFEDPLAQDRAAAVIDYVGGLADIEHKIIRAIGDPDERLGEDYLRMLRAVRFAARLGFTIEERTARAIRFHAGQLGQISRERIGGEVEQMLEGGKRQEARVKREEASGSRRVRAAGLMQELHLDGPALHEEHVSHGPAILGALAEEASYPAALAAWLLDRHFSPERAGAAGSHEPPLERLTRAMEAFASHEADTIVKRWRRALCLSNEQRNALGSVFVLLPKVLAWPTLAVAPRKRLLASAGWSDTLAVVRAAAGRWGVAELVHRVEVESQALLSEGVAPPPLVSGDDLVAMGRKPGPAFRRLLEEAYDAQLEGALTTREQALEWLRSRGE